MKFLNGTNAVFLVLSMFGSTTNVSCYAAPGDIITHSTVRSSTGTYRVAGWQHELVQGAPNLQNYYWEPLTKRIVNTTRTTSRQATDAPNIAYKKIAHRYVNPIHLRLPLPNRSQPESEKDNLHNDASTRVNWRADVQPILSYSTDLNWQSAHHLAETTSSAAKESVYGVLKSTGVKAKAGSL